MKIFSSLHILAALGVLGVATAASAQVDTSQWKCTSCPYPKGTTGSVDAGAEYVSDSSQKFGDYTGLANEGAYAILGGSASRRGDDGYWADISGSDLGLDSRRINGQAGREGLYTLRIGYAEIPRHLTQGAATPFLGSGGNALTLPGGFPAGDTASMPLGSTLQPIDIGYKYRRFDLGGTVVGGRDWSYRLNYRHDERDGTKPTSGSFFSTASQFLAPVKEKTDQAEIGLSYGTKRLAGDGELPVLDLPQRQRQRHLVEPVLSGRRRRHHGTARARPRQPVPAVARNGRRTTSRRRSA